MSSTPDYRVWRRSEHETFKIWHPEHFAADDAPMLPRLDDPQLVYYGPDYAEAWRICGRANRAGFGNDDSTERIRAETGLGPSSAVDKGKVFTDSLFG